MNKHLLHSLLPLALLPLAACGQTPVSHNSAASAPAAAGQSQRGGQGGSEDQGGAHRKLHMGELHRPDRLDSRWAIGRNGAGYRYWTRTVRS